MPAGSTIIDAATGREVVDAATGKTRYTDDGTCEGCECPERECWDLFRNCQPPPLWKLAPVDCEGPSVYELGKVYDTDGRRDCFIYFGIVDELPAEEHEIIEPFPADPVFDTCADCAEIARCVDIARGYNCAVEEHADSYTATIDGIRLYLFDELVCGPGVSLTVLVDPDNRCQYLSPTKCDGDFGLPISIKCQEPGAEWVLLFGGIATAAFAGFRRLRRPDDLAPEGIYRFFDTRNADGWRFENIPDVAVVS